MKGEIKVKKLIAVLVVLLCYINIFSVCVIASDDEVVIINPVLFDAENNSLTISGVVNDTRDRIPVTLYISNGDAIIVATETQAEGFSEEGIPYEFKPIYLGYDTPSGDFTITVSARFIGKSSSLTYTYKGVDKQHEALTKLSVSINTGNDTQYISDLHTYSDALGIDIDSFDNLSDTAEGVTVRSLMAHEYILPLDYDTSEECFLVQEAVKSFTAHFKEAMVLGDFFNVSCISEVKEWYLNNKEYYSLHLDDEDTIPDESKMVEYFEGILKSENYLGRRSYMTSVLTVKDLHPIMKYHAILQTIEDSGQYVVKQIVDNFPNLLTYLDYNAWDSIADTNKKTSACISVAGKRYTTIEQFCNALNDAITLVLSSNTSDDDGKRGGSSYSGGGGSISVNPNVVTDVVKPIASFSDMQTDHWAWSAVHYLFSEGVVSGKTSDIFAPSEYITRAEFAKMITLAFKLSDTANGLKFNDVDSSAWYVAYVSAAAEHGIVLGDGKGNFNPQGLVTRQDAAVMLHRADGSPNSMAKANFKDYSDISSYAKPAVDYMYANGIINGVGDGIFAPKANLTRAAVAKMLYLILTQ